MSGKMNSNFSRIRLNNFELLHRANYFSDKKNKCDGVTLGVSEVLLNILLILHMITPSLAWQGKTLRHEMYSSKYSSTVDTFLITKAEK